MMAEPVEPSGLAATDRSRGADRSWLVPLVIAAGVLLLVLAASTDPIRIWTDLGPGERTDVAEPTEPTDDAPTIPVADDPVSPARSIPWLRDVFNVLGVLILGGVALATLLVARDMGGRFWLRGRARVAPPVAPGADVKASSARPAPAIDEVAARSALGAGAPRNAIVSCWMELERAARRNGLKRGDAETSAEFVQRALQTSNLDPGPLRDLASLYREARFSRHEVTAAHRGRAAEALERLIEQLRDERGRR